MFAFFVAVGQVLVDAGSFRHVPQHVLYWSHLSEAALFSFFSFSIDWKVLAAADKTQVLDLLRLVAVWDLLLCSAIYTQISLWRLYSSPWGPFSLFNVCLASNWCLFYCCISALPTDRKVVKQLRKVAPRWRMPLHNGLLSLSMVSRFMVPGVLPRMQHKAWHLLLLWRIKAEDFLDHSICPWVQSTRPLLIFKSCRRRTSVRWSSRRLIKDCIWRDRVHESCTTFVLFIPRRILTNQVEILNVWGLFWSLLGALATI